MTASTSFLTESKFYSPIFNSAIYDGPFRIYFSQHQESLGLKAYFSIQHQNNEFYKAMKDRYKQTGEQVFILLYPTEESYELAFAESKSPSSVKIEKVGDNSVFGILTASGEVPVTTLVPLLKDLLPEQPLATT